MARDGIAYPEVCGGPWGMQLESRCCLRFGHGDGDGMKATTKSLALRLLEPGLQYKGFELSHYRGFPTSWRAEDKGDVRMLPCFTEYPITDKPP